MRFFSHHKKTRENSIKALFRAIFNTTRLFEVSARTRVTGLVASIFLVLIAGFFISTAVAQNDWHTVETVLVFPEQVTVQGWKNIEGVGVQNLSEVALAQEFTKRNSAYIDTKNNTTKNSANNNSKVESDTTVSESPNTDAETVADDISNESATNQDAARNEENNAVSGVMPEDSDSTTPHEEESSSGSAEEPIEEESEVGDTIEIPEEDLEIQEEVTNKDETTSQSTDTPSEPISLFDRVSGSFNFVFASAYELLPFAQENESTELQEEVSVDSNDSSASADATNGEETPSAQMKDLETETEPTEDTELTLELTPELEKDSEVETAGAHNVPTASTSDESTFVPEETEKSTTTLEMDTDAPSSSSSDQKTAENDTVCIEDCDTHTIRLSGFGLPIFDEKTSLGGLQLRLSAGAQLKQDVTDPVSLDIWYSYDQGAHFERGGSIEIIDEISNGINGGYYLFALPTPDNVAKLDDLTIEVRYSDDVDAIEGLFVDSVWVELFMVTAPELLQMPIEALMADDGYDDRITQGDKLVLPDGREIDFTFTDDNKDETLIIKSDRETYPGLTKTDLHFNVTNTSDKSDVFSLQAYFPKNTGKVVAVEEWEQNKPREVVIPEYQPFVYHCEAGWETTNNPVNASLEDVSKQLSPAPVNEVQNEKEDTDLTEAEESSNSDVTDTSATDSSTNDHAESAEEASENNQFDASETEAEKESDTLTDGIPPSSEPETLELETPEPVIDETSALPSASSALPFTQFALETNTASRTDDLLVSEEQTENDGEVDETDLTETYVCRNTNITRACDSITGENTECRVENVKVREHLLTQFERGWSKRSVEEGAKPGSKNFLKKTLNFFGFGPDQKEIPETFEARAHSPEQYTIAAGETKYFKMTIEFPVFSSGEFWIEAVGKREYGLLDPFWSSQWRYRKPITIDNLLGATSTEQQVFVELDATESDFWSKVQSDGGDIRFVSETPGDTVSTWYDQNWSDRVPLVIDSSVIDDDLTDFPVYVDLADLGPDFFSGVQASGADIRITEGDKVTEVPYELVSIDTGAKTGELHFKAASLSSTTDSTFYVYYGNGAASSYAATSTYGSENVWSSEYQAVYHLEEDAAGAGNDGLYKDATVNAYHADDEITSTGKLGQIGKGQEIRSRETNPDDHIMIPSGTINSENVLSFSFWFNTNQNADQALTSAGPNNHLLFFLRNTQLVLYDANDTATFNLDTDVTGTGWNHLTIIRDSNNNRWSLFVNGVEDNTSPEAETLAALSIPANCFMIGGEHDTCSSAWDQPQEFDGYVDEYRILNSAVSSAWVAATYDNQNIPTNFYSTSTVETFTPTTFTELDYWIQYFDYAREEADVWVQVDELPGFATSTIYLYYGNATSDTTSDEYAPFTYSTSTDLYYVVNGYQTNPIVVYSLIDGNEVSIDGGTPVPLDSGETTSFSSYASSSVISALGPITARANDKYTDAVVPISFATTTFASPGNRQNEFYYTYAPFGDAGVSIYNSNSGTPTASGTTTAGFARLYNPTITTAGILEASAPVLLHSRTSNGDGIVSYPPTTRPLFGIHSTQYWYTPIAAGGDVGVYCSSGAHATNSSVARGSHSGNNVCTGASLGTGNGVMLVPTTVPIAAIQQADGGGSESTSYLPTPEFGTRYIVPQDASYVSVVCSPRFGTSTIEIRTAAGVYITGGDCNAGGSTPGMLNFNVGGAFAQGSQIVSTNNVPFYTYYEQNSGGYETNTWSAVQAKKYNSLYYQSTFGPEEENEDAQYEQKNYRWYQNLNDITPTTPWDIDGTAVAEGEAITDQGAINPGDVLRLRMNLQANNGTGTVASTAFVLEYAQADTCNAVVEDSWFVVGEVGSSTAAFAGFNNAGQGDGTTLTSSLLSDTDILGTYEEENNSATLPNEVGNGQTVEFDWSITPVVIDSNSNYCFRMVRASGEKLATYTAYPKVLTAGPPEIPITIKRFDNEKASSMKPTFRFAAVDQGGDELQYQIQISTDNTFGSTVIDSSSVTNFLDFVNVNNPSDKAPFDNGQLIEYTTKTALSDGTTYWWRVRASDPGGSNTFSSWTTPKSFTVDISVAVSEWFQTTDEQFNTNSHTGSVISGSDSVELAIAGSNLIGEYGTVAMTNGATSTVSLNNSYTNPVVVASVRYPRTVANREQVAARVFNKTGTSFDVLTVDYDRTETGTSTVDYMVVEAGEYLMDDGGDGLRMYATSTSVTAYAGQTIPANPGGSIITFPTPFSAAPVVLSMVTTNNDPDWVVSTVYDGNNRTNPPTSSQVSVFLNDGAESDGHSSAEDIDIIAFDKGVGTNNSVAFDIGNTGAVVTHTPYTHNFSNSFGSIPGVTLVSQLTTNGSQGSYAMVDLDNPATASGVTISADESGSADRSHAPEDMGIVAFEDASGDIIRAGKARMTSTIIDFDDADVGNAWGEISWNDTGDVTYKVEYQTGSGFQLIPDSDLPGNSTGFTDSPINILNLDTDVYNQIRLTADLAGVNPEIFDWTVKWGQRVEIPTLGDLFDNEKTADTTPTFDFVSTDPQGDDLTYEISISTDPTFMGASTTVNSSASSSDFYNITDSNTNEPYGSGDTVSYTLPASLALSNNTTYWWRVRAKDPNGNNSYSPWSDPDSFTVDTTVSLSTWFQTTKAQFSEGVIDGVIASTSDSVTVTNEVGEYGTTTVTANTWQTITTELSYENMVVVASPEYAHDGSTNGRTAQIRNKTANSFEIRAENDTESLGGTTVIHYLAIESGDWLLENGGAGLRMLAGTAEDVSNVESAAYNGIGGTTITFNPAFSSAPEAILTISSANNSKWTGTAVSANNDEATEITTNSMDVSMGISRDTDTVREPEDIDYIVFDTGFGTNNGTLFDALRGTNISISGTSVNYNQTFSTAPRVTLVHNNGTNGADGAFAQKDTGIASTNGFLRVSVAEMGTGAGSHNGEDVSILAFEASEGTIIRDDSVSGGLSGTIASEPIYFSDGAGPKFSQALFSFTSPGNSTTSVQVEYQTATGSWALIPDGQISNNSIGNTTGTIDLTNVNVATYPIIRLLATLTCDASNCPELHDWSVEWSEGVTMSGTLKKYDQMTNVANATVTVSVNGATPVRTGTVSAGVWSISNVTAFEGDTVTVFVSDVPDDEEAVAVFVYDGSGDMTGVEMFEQHLSLSSDETATVTIAHLGASDYGLINDEDVFFNVDYSGNLSVCAINGCEMANLYIGPGNTFVPATTTSKNIFTHDFINDGTVELDNNKVYVSGSWIDNGSVSSDTSHVTFTGSEGGWYNNNWQSRLPITIASSKVNASLNDFPVYVDLSDLPASFFSGVKANGGDIRITQSDGITEVPFELVNINTGTQTGQLHFKAPRLSDTVDSTFYLYFDNPSASSYAVTDTYGRNNVWTDYEAVWHFADTNFIDSTGNPRTPANTGVTATTIGTRPAINFNGSSYLNFGNEVNMGLGDLSISVYVQTTDSSASYVAKSFYSAQDSRYALIHLGGNLTSLFDAGTANANNDYSGTFRDGTFRQAAVTYDRDGNNSLYTDGVLRLTKSIAPYSGYDFNKTNNLYVGAYNNSAGTGVQTALNFTGKMTELKMSRNVLSPEWLAAEHSNQTSASSFYSIGTVSSPSSPGTPTYEYLSGALNFNTLSFNDAVGGTVWETLNDVVVKDNLSVAVGTLNRSTSSIVVAKNLTTGTYGFWSGIGTTTFNGAGTSVWVDANPISQNIGNVVVDGAVRSVSIGSNVRAETIMIGTNDTLNGGGTYDIQIGGNFTNKNIFIAGSSRIVVVGTSTSAAITTNGSNLYGFRASSSGGSISFTNPSVTVLDNFEIATGTVTLPTTLLRVGGSFSNTGGYFAHNNSEVRFTGTGTETIELQGDSFLNSFYDVRFNGSGNWSFVDTHATTSNTFTIDNGSVTLPSGQLSVARNFTTNAPGSFNANGGEVLFFIEGNDKVTTNNSSFNNVRVLDGTGGSLVWYDPDWEYRIPITIRATEIDDDLTNFPVYVDLADFSSTNLFDYLNADGGDIRITEGDELTEVAREIVFASTTAKTGQLHFLATNISSTTDTVFYMYYGNSAASDYAVSDTYGAQNVWSNNYIATYHLNESQSGTGNSNVYIDSSGNSYHGDDEINATGKTGKVGSGQQILGRSVSPNDDHIVLPRGVLNGRTNVTSSFWMNTSNGNNQAIVSAGANNEYLSWYQPNLNQFTLFAGTPADKPLPSISDGNWHFVTIVRNDTSNQYILYVDGAAIGTPMTKAMSALSIPANCTVIGQEQDGCLGFDYDQAFEGYLDEMTFRSTVSDADWVAATYRNQATTTDFYAVGSAQNENVRTFSDSSVTAVGDVVIESGSAVFPTGNFNVGGSFDNDGEFDANGGTIFFNSPSGTETISFGTSLPNHVRFDSVNGDWTVIDSATTTGNVVLASVGDFTLDSGRTLNVGGQFNNMANGASTTWTGSKLLLSSNTNYSINDKTSGGDTYNILELVDDTDVKMWNSTAATYTTKDTSSIYSQDHAGTDGDLYIFGDYDRTTGTEHWSYATDFDGTDLSGGSERQVDVRVENGAHVRVSTSTLMMAGVTGASTTVAAQSGSFALTAAYATVTANYFEVSGTDTNGLNLTSSSTVTSLDDALFTIGTGMSAITVDATTIDTNPAAQFFNTDFVTGGGSVNVTLSGSPSSYWWFRDGSGDRYGETFDNADGDPGSIRWDDSNYQINISGTVYADDGQSTLGGPTCDGSTNAVRIVVDGGAYTDFVPCNGIDGSYNFSNVSYNGDATILVYLDTNGGRHGSVITRTPTTDITDLNVYADRVLTRHENTAPMTIARVALYDEAQDNDLRFSAATSTGGNILIVRPDTELYVYATTTFAPGGTITLESGGTGNVFDGTLHLGPAATFTGVGTTTYSVGGSIILETGAHLATASSTFDMTATTTGKTITGSSTIDFYELTFNGSGGGWNINTDITTAVDLFIATGTVTGTGDITVKNGSMYGDGLVSLGDGTTYILTSNTFGGAQSWTFNNLTLGSGLEVGTTTPASSATTTVTGTFTINTAHTLDAGASHWSLEGSGAVFVENGTFLEDTSLVRYGGTLGNTVLDTAYYDLVIEASGSSPTFTTDTGGIQIFNNLRVGGATTSTFTLDATDPIFTVNGDVFIAENGTLVGSNTNDLTVSGSWDNNGIFSGSNGLVNFNSADPFTIAAGDSPFADVTITGTGAATISEHATSSGAWTFASTSDVTVSAGQRLAVGGDFNNNAAGNATDWTGSTLHLFGTGQYEINTPTTADEYGTVSAAANTHIRTWNSSSSAYVTAVGGSIYSMDHADVAGDLYIFGDYTQNSVGDYWSYATDFDGTDLSGGGERKVDVYVENGGSITYSGGTLEIVGTASASTTISVQSTGDYSFDISAGTFEAQYYEFRDLDSDGLTITGAPNISSLSYGDWTLDTNGDAALTIAGTVLDQNPGKNILNNRFATTSGVSTAVNVRTTGSSVSSWRYNFHTGDVDGEDFDDDGGDPGYIVWDNSTTTYAVGGTVYESDASTPSSVCGATSNIVLVVNNANIASTTCDGSGHYLFEDINFDSNDSITVYINDETDNAVTITKEPISTINNLDLYENHVIVRHENTSPLTIADMAAWDSSDDAGDIPFTVVSGSPDTLTIATGNGLFVWTNKEFEPQGNVTISGGGSGQQYNGALMLGTNAVFTANGTEVHTVGGSIASKAGAVFDAANSTTTFTSTNGGRLIDINNGSFYNVAFTSGGNWTVTDAILDVNNLKMTAGALTLPNGTTTVSGSFNKTSGTLNYNGGTMVFDGSGANNIIAFDDSTVGELVFTGLGSWNMSDVHATSVSGVRIESGTLSLPSGSLSLGGSFRNEGGAITHNTSHLIIGTSSAATLLASSSDLYAVTFTGGGTFSMEDNSLSLLDTLTVDSGTLALASGTLSIGGSFDASGGTFDSATGTVLFNSADTGETVKPGTSDFYNIQFGNTGGGWTIEGNATATNNFTIAAASSFTQQSGTRLVVGNVFTNNVGGISTTWTGSTLALTGGTAYSINTKTSGGDKYDTLEIAANTDIRSWDSSASTLTVDPTASLYSQDHDGTSGHLNIYGDFHIGTTTEYWSYATDFDGTILGGGSRQVTVSIASGATTTVGGGALAIIGAPSATTTIQNQGSGNYAFSVEDGTYNAKYYAYRNLDINGLVLKGTPTITSLSYGDFALAVDNGSMITLSSTTLSANPSKLIYNVRFATTSTFSGYNVNLNATTTNAWSFKDHSGNRDGELYDNDGVDDCGSIRWDDSSCLLVEQTHYRWRNDDNGLGAPNTEWFSASWDKRQRTRVINNDNVTYATTSVQMSVTYDTDMQSDFEDLRFTADDGVTPLSHWIEDYTASTDAIVWIEIPSLPANGAYDAYMYYDNVTAISTSSSTEVFVVADDFEDNNISEYSGDTTKFQTEAASAFGGSYGVGPVINTDFTADGIARFDQTINQGEIIRYMQYIDTGSGGSDESCTLFGVQSPVTNNNNYAVCLEIFGTDRISLVRNAERSDNYGAVVMLASSTVSYTTGWYEVEIDWQTNDDIDVSLYDSSGSLVTTVSANDSTYSNGGFGFTYWSQHGGWDSFTSRYRTNSKPSVVFGGEQVANGASWNAALDTPSSDFEIGDVARARFAVENSGLTITDQEFLLEYAPKGNAPSCESVGPSAYDPVPTVGSCGTDAVCMVDSPEYTSGAAIADLLTDTNGSYVFGKAIDNNSNKTSAIDLPQNSYTEIEYAITSTVNASDSAYCLRVTDNGAALDSYAAVAEFTLQFKPSLSTFTLNGGDDIVLIPGATTTIVATGTVTDLNGYGDLASATTTFYRGGVGAACTEDPNNCYVSAGNPQCQFTNCSGNSCDLECSADFYYHADPTDDGVYSGEEWFAFGEVVDSTGFSSFNSSIGVELMTLRALNVDNAIDYGALEVYQDTGSYNASTTVSNEGNDAIDVQIVGDNLSDGLSSIIPADKQIFATSTFTYSSCTYCTTASTSPVTYDLDLSKPTSSSTPVTDKVYWGIYIPFGTKSNPHTGVNIFYAISDS